MEDTADQEHLRMSARELIRYRLVRARSRDRVRAILDAMAAEARRVLGSVFTDNDPLTNAAVALVVRSDERLPDDYERQTPRPLTDTRNALIVEVLGRAIRIEMTDAGVVRASGETTNVALGEVTSVRLAGTASNPAAYLVIGGGEGVSPSEIPFIRVLADLIDAALQGEARVAGPELAEVPQAVAERTPAEPPAPKVGVAT